jgi:hypothetical protein
MSNPTYSEKQLLLKTPFYMHHKPFSNKYSVRIIATYRDLTSSPIYVVQVVRYVIDITYFKQTHVSNLLARVIDLLNGTSAQVSIKKNFTLNNHTSRGTNMNGSPGIEPLLFESSCSGFSPSHVYQLFPKMMTEDIISPYTSSFADRVFSMMCQIANPSHPRHSYLQHWFGSPETNVFS